MQALDYIALLALFCALFFLLLPLFVACSMTFGVLGNTAFFIMLLALALALPRQSQLAVPTALAAAVHASVGAIYLTTPAHCGDLTSIMAAPIVLTSVIASPIQPLGGAD